jgi:hypothetical protein
VGNTSWKGFGEGMAFDSFQFVQEIRAGSQRFKLTCQEETSSNITACTINSQWKKQAACEVGVIKAKGEVKVCTAIYALLRKSCLIVMHTDMIVKRPWPGYHSKGSWSSAPLTQHLSNVARGAVNRQLWQPDLICTFCNNCATQPALCR